MRILIMVRVVAAVLISIASAHAAAAQSLGEVARKEEERRKAIKSTGKVYTNDKLKPAPQPSAPPTSSPGQASTTAPSTASPEPAPSDTASNKPSDTASDKSDKEDEASWRKRITEARESLQRSQTFAAALQNQLNSLQADFVNRDDPVQRSAIAVNRDKVAAELERVKKEAAAHTKAISDIQEEARRAGVPAGWVR